MPEKGYPVSPKGELLSFEEIARLVGIAVGLGIKKVRLTGGEPLVRKDLPYLIRLLRSYEIEDLSLTTNGYLLAGLAQELKDCGLDRVNISIDTLRHERFLAIARRGDLESVMNGLRAAIDVGLRPVKINCVLMKGVNDDEVVDFARLSIDQPLHVRFIELMPIRWNLDTTDGFETMSAMHGASDLFRLREAEETGMLSDSDMRRRVVPIGVAIRKIEKEFGELIAAEIRTNGPARSYKIPGAQGTVGLISQISNDLCERCNRLRLTADGQLRPCLMSDGEVDFRTPLRGGATEEQIAELILEVVAHKPERHYLAEGQKVLGRGMSQIGG
jgi:cyclic pyranopterin phosphate synthase